MAGTGVIRAQGDRLLREPKIVSSQNSQTIELLKGHLNLSSSFSLGNKVAVVDNNALVAETPVSGDTFTEFGIAGSGQISTYIVRQGDSLSVIAKMFGVSVNTIAWANDIKGGRIAPGQSLVILPISGVKHIVSKGDTIQSIAKKYNADVTDITSYNGLTSSSKLAIGDEVIVPDGEIKSVSASAPVYSGSNSTVASGYFIRPVQGGRKTQGLHGHNGVDLGGLPIGTPVLAAADGVVIAARSSGYNGGYGLYLVISHSNGTQTLYSHLSAVNVSTGERVDQGQIVGRLGNSGKSTGPHLHFEVRGARNPF
ncbi:MAG: peptidoglycan DD-metalloendopeptidase family protein [Patescibacteria group bacterium]